MLLLGIILVCQITAGDNLTDVPEVKISVITVDDHLRPENTGITKELVSKLIIIC